jgi:ribosome-associated protein
MSTPHRVSDPTDLHGLPPAIRLAVQAAHEKKALDVIVMDLHHAAAFTDYFVICSGLNPRQVRAIADSIGDVLLKARVRPAHLEGYDLAEWVLIDYFDFVVHVFSQETRAFYALDRLWGSARRIALPAPDGRGGGVSSAP